MAHLEFIFEFPVSLRITEPCLGTDPRLATYIVQKTRLINIYAFGASHGWLQTTAFK